MNEAEESKYFCIYPHRHTWLYKQEEPGKSAPLCNRATCKRKVRRTTTEDRFVEACHYHRLTDPNDGFIDYNERNSRNLAHVYEEELKQIHNGARASLMLSYRNLRNLTENGLLGREARHRRVKLTDKAREHLGLGVSTAKFYAYTDSARYHCTKCGVEHYEGSGIGKKHLQYKR